VCVYECVWNKLMIGNEIFPINEEEEDEKKITISSWKSKWSSFSL